MLEHHFEQCTHAMHRAMLPSNATYVTYGRTNGEHPTNQHLLGLSDAGRAYEFSSDSGAS